MGGKIFKSSIEAVGWQTENCFQCSKYGETLDDCTCPLAQKIDLALLGDPEPEPKFFEPWGFNNGAVPVKCLQLELAVDKESK